MYTRSHNSMAISKKGPRRMHTHTHAAEWIYSCDIPRTKIYIDKAPAVRHSSARTAVARINIFIIIQPPNEEHVVEVKASYSGDWWWGG